MRYLLFSLTKKDFEFQYFKAPGPGGQRKNKVMSAARCIHTASGAVAEASESRHQLQNKEEAFVRCVQSEKFRGWHKVECARRLGKPTPEFLASKYVEDQFADLRNFKIEIQVGKAQWKEVSLLEFMELNKDESLNDSDFEVDKQ